MCSPSAPAAPDYTAAAVAEGESSQALVAQQTAANRPDQTTPWGTSSWEMTPGTNGAEDSWAQTVTLTPEQQQALDSQMGLQAGRSDLALSMLGRAEGEYADEMDWSQFSSLGTTPEMSNFQNSYDFSGANEVQNPTDIRQQAEDSLYNNFTSRADDMFASQGSDLEVSLRNQGLNPGDEAYDRAMGEFSDAKTDAYQQAAFDASIGGGQEASRQFDMASALRSQDVSEAMSQTNLANTNANTAFSQGLTASNYDNQIRQQEISEAMQERGFSINEINAILTGQQVGMTSMPGFNTAGVSQAPQLLNAASQQYQGDLDAYSLENQGMNNLMSGGGSLAMAFM